MTPFMRVRGAAAAAAGKVLDTWFKPAQAAELAAARFALYATAWYVMPRRDLTEWLAYGKVAWRPVGIFRALELPLFSAPVLAALTTLFWVSVACSALGFVYRLSSAAAALTGLYVLGLGNNFGKVDHGANLFALALFIFAMARAADAWSVDQLLLQLWRRRKVAGRGAGLELARAGRRMSGEYRWPRELVLLTVVVMYCSAGISKLRYSGWAWALSDGFQNMLLRHHFTHSPPTDLGVVIARYDWLCQGLALFALLIELLCPLALLSRWLRWFFLGGLMGLQFGIRLLMGVAFRPMMPVFFCLLPWVPALSVLVRATSRAPFSTLVSPLWRRVGGSRS